MQNDKTNNNQNNQFLNNSSFSFLINDKNMLVSEVIDALSKVISSHIDHLFDTQFLNGGQGRRQSEVLVEQALQIFFDVINANFKYLHFDSRVGRNDFYYYQFGLNYHHQELNEFNALNKAKQGSYFKQADKSFNENELITDYNELIIDSNLNIKNLQVDRHVYLNDLLFAFIENKSFLDLSNQKRAFSDAVLLFKSYLQKYPFLNEIHTLRFYIFGVSDERNTYSALNIKTITLNDLEEVGLSNIELKALFIKQIDENNDRHIFYKNHNNYKIDFEKVRQVVLTFLYDFIVCYQYYKCLKLQNKINLNQIKENIQEADLWKYEDNSFVSFLNFNPQTDLKKELEINNELKNNQEHFIQEHFIHPNLEYLQDAYKNNFFYVLNNLSNMQKEYLTNKNQTKKLKK